MARWPWNWWRRDPDHVAALADVKAATIIEQSRAEHDRVVVGALIEEQRMNNFTARLSLGMARTAR